MPAEFRKAMDRTIINAKNTFCFLDDILKLSKGTKSEHQKLVKEVLGKLDQKSLSPKMSKSGFFMNEVNWPGHKLSENGVTPKITKAEAI